jgi:hypothetical protein
MPSMRLPRFVGRDKDDVLAWVHIIDLILKTYNIPEYIKVANVVPLLTNNAGAFYFKIYMESERISTWSEQSHALIQCYENVTGR